MKEIIPKPVFIPIIPQKTLHKSSVSLSPNLKGIILALQRSKISDKFPKRRNFSFFEDSLKKSFIISSVVPGSLEKRIKNRNNFLSARSTNRLDRSRFMKILQTQRTLNSYCKRNIKV